MGDQVRLFPAASGDYLKAEFAADEGLIQLAENSLKIKEEPIGLRPRILHKRRVRFR